MKKFLGVFNTKKKTPEQIYKEVVKALSRKEKKTEAIKDFNK